MTQEAELNLNVFCATVLDPGMNAAVRAVTRMGIYVGAKVYLIYEVNILFVNPLNIHTELGLYSCLIWISLTHFYFSGIPGPGGWRRQHQTGTLAQCDQHHPTGRLKSHQWWGRWL